jgi:hypothetical protein
MTIDDTGTTKPEHLIKATVMPENQAQAEYLTKETRIILHKDNQETKLATCGSTDKNNQLNKLYQKLKAIMYSKTNPIAKIIYSYQNEQQTIKSAYQDNSPIRVWRESVICALYESYSNAKDKSTKFDILRFIAEVHLMPDEKLLDAITGLALRFKRLSAHGLTTEHRYCIMRLHGLIKLHPDKLQSATWVAHSTM